MLRWGKTYWQVAAEQAERPKVDIEVDAQIEGSLAAEASLVVLDSLELLVQTVSLQSMLGKVGSYWRDMLVHNTSLVPSPHPRGEGLVTSG